MSVTTDISNLSSNSEISQVIAADLQQLKVFISHRHADGEFASVITERLREWGFSTDHIFASSRPEGGVVPGDNIEQSVKENLSNCNLLIHIFTRSSHNWQWVAREIGIAETLSNPPRIVTFQIFEDEPSIGQSSMRVPLEEIEIRRFVHSLFTKDSFFPGHPPVSPDPEEEGFKKQSHNDYIENQSQQLYLQLSETATKLGSADLKPVNQTVPELSIFISSRVEDIALAEKLKDKIESWSFFKVMLSHSKKPSGETVSSSGREIVNFLWECHLVILLFTDTNADWGQCDSEIGTAHGPQVPTNTIVLQVLEDSPNIRIPAGMCHFFVDTRNILEVQKFIDNLFHKPNFFPGYAAVQLEKSQPWKAYTKSEANDLYAMLEEHRSKPISERKPEPYEEEPRWSQICFRLSYENYTKCLEHDTKSEKQDFAQILRQSLTVSGGIDFGLRHFGFTDLEKTIEDNITLDQMFQYWKSTTNDPNSNMEWADELASEIWAFRIGKGGYNLTWKPFHNLNAQAPCYVYPVVTSVEKYHDESRTYTIHLFVIPERILKDDQPRA
ncbi:toll/interleukin-1 receptor domain-containing protein [Nitrospira sp. M1]